MPPMGVFLKLIIIFFFLNKIPIISFCHYPIFKQFRCIVFATNSLHISSLIMDTQCVLDLQTLFRWILCNYGVRELDLHIFLPTNCVIYCIDMLLYAYLYFVYMQLSHFEFYLGESTIFRLTVF